MPPSFDEWKEKLTNPARDWLLTILHFAVTLERSDRATVLAMARELDRPGTGEVEMTFAFFVRTSFEFCNAIADKNDPNRIAVLRRIGANRRPPSQTRARSGNRNWALDDAVGGVNKIPAG